MKAYFVHFKESQYRINILAKKFKVLSTVQDFGPT